MAIGETRAARARRFFFGDDIFLSYSRHDSAYALALADELTKQNLACFLDQWGTPPGVELPLELVERLNKSTMLVIIGTQWAADSDNVGKEIVEFKKTKRPIIPLTFVEEDDFSRIRNNEIPENLKGSLESAAWYNEIVGIARTAESKAKLRPDEQDGKVHPSPEVVTRIVNAEGFLSRSKRLRKAFWTTFALLLAILVAAGVIASALVVKANQKVREAQAEQAAAERTRNEAQEKTRKAQEDLLVEQEKLSAAQRELKTVSDNLTAEQEKLKKASDDLKVANQRVQAEQARAEQARLEAEKQGRIASSQERAARAVSRMASDPEASVILAKDAYNFAPTEQAGRALRHSLLQSHVYSIAREGDGLTVLDIDSTGQYVIAKGDNETLNVKRAETGELLKTLPGRAEFTNVDGFSPDGKYVVITSGDDKTDAVFLWEWAADQSPRNPLTLYSDVNANDVAPCQCVSPFCPIMSTAFSSDGRYLAAASRRGVAWVWDTASGERVAKFTAGESAINAVRFAPFDHRYVATADNEGQVMLWDWKAKEGETNRWVYRQAGSSGSVTALAFDSRGQFLAAAVNPKYPGCVTATSPPDVYEAVVFNISTREQVTLVGHVSTVEDISFSPDPYATYVLTGSRDGTARVYEWADGKNRANPVILKHGDVVFDASFDPSGEYVLTSGMDRTPRLWRPSIGRKFGESNGRTVDSPSLSILRGHTERVRARFSTDGKFILTTSDDGTARVWRANAARVKSTLPEQGREIGGAAFSPDGKHVVTTGWSLPVRVWLAGGERREPEAELSDGDGEERGDYRYAFFSADGRYVIAAKNRGQGQVNAQVVHYWEWAERSGRTKPQSIVMPDGVLYDMAVSQNREGATYIVTASGAGDTNVTAESEDKTLNAARVWRLSPDEGGAKPVVLPHPKPVLAAAFSHDRESRYVVTASADGVRIFDWARSDKPLVHLNVPIEQYGFAEVALSPDGRYVAAAQRTGILVCEWQLGAGCANPIMLRSDSDTATVEGMAWVESIAFSPDSKLVLVARGGSTLSLWEVATGDKLQIIDEHPNSDGGASFSQDGRYIISPFYETARIYDCPECRPEDTLVDSVSERISLQALRLSGRSNTQAPKVRSHVRSRLRRRK